MRILPPRSVKPRAHLFAGLYGPGGSGKTLLALKMAHRLAVETGAEIVFIDADEGRADFYSEFQFRPIPFREKFSVLELIEEIDTFTEIARAEPDSIVLIIDSLTPFHTGPGGLNDRNNNFYAGEFKGNTWSAWSKTGPLEEDPMYAAMRRFTKHGHLILCLEEAPDYNGKDLVGVKPRFRDGFGHRVDTLIRVERYFQQAVTKREEKPKPGTVATDVHRAIIEKVSIAWNEPRSDGTVETEYPIETGTLIANPQGDIATRLLEYINKGAENYQGSIDEYVEGLKEADRDELLKAYGYAKRVAWPEAHRQALMDAIVSLGSKFQTTEGAPPAPPLNDIVDAVHAAAGMQHIVNVALELSQQYAWSELTMNHHAEEWMQAAEDLDNHCESDIELDAFLARAKQCGRWDDVHEVIENRKGELAHDRKVESFRDTQGLDANEIY